MHPSNMNLPFTTFLHMSLAISNLCVFFSAPYLQSVSSFQPLTRNLCLLFSPLLAICVFFSAPYSQSVSSFQPHTRNLCLLFSPLLAICVFFSAPYSQSVSSFQPLTCNHTVNFTTLQRFFFYDICTYLILLLTT